MDPDRRTSANDGLWLVANLRKRLARTITMAQIWRLAGTGCTSTKSMAGAFFNVAQMT